MKRFNALILLLLSSCAVGPNYKTPEIALDSSYHEPHETGSLSELKEWWTTFDDPLLNTLIEEALSQNLELKIALEKIHQVRAEYQIEAAELYPKVDLSAEQRRTKISQNLFDSTFLGPPIQSLYRAGFDASWEIDLFGKRRRAKEGAYYSYEAEVSNTRDVYLTLLSEIATTYIQTRSFQQKIALSKREIAIQKERLILSQSRFIAGLDSEILSEETVIHFEKAEALLPLLEMSLRKSLHRLSVLLGKAPEKYLKGFEELEKIPVSKAPIPIGLPSDLLRRRPDIRKAERLLAAATARVGEAIGNLFPRFSLLGSFGFESNHSNSWLKGKSQSWSLGPQIDWPILYFGRIRANIRAQTAKEEEALLNYEQTILTSLEDVENRLVSYYKEEERLHRYEMSVEAAQRIYTLTLDQYSSGLVDFLTLLEADSALVSAENDLIQSQENLSTCRVALYKSLGGDW